MLESLVQQIHQRYAVDDTDCLIYLSDTFNNFTSVLVATVPESSLSLTAGTVFANPLLRLVYQDQLRLFAESFPLSVD